MSVKRYLFVVFPGYSHLSPVIPVAQNLRRQGQVVAFASNNTLKDLIEGEGFQFYQVGAADLTEERLYRNGADLNGLFGFELNHRLWERLFIPLAETMTKDLLRLVPQFRPDLIFADATVYGAPIVSEITRAPWASYIAGIFLHDSVDLAPIGPGFPPPRTERDRRMYARWKSAPAGGAKQDVIDRVSGWDAALNRLRAKHGLVARSRPTLDKSELLVISFTGESFEYPRRDLPPQVHFVGPSLWDTAQPNYELPAALKNRLPGKPLIYLTLGTVFNSCRRVWEICVKALKDIDAQVVTTTGRHSDPAAFGDLPGNFIVERFIPPRLIFPMLDLVICHAGFGTTMDALSHGVPLVCIPVAADNPEIAQRVQEAGAGLRLDHVMSGERLTDVLTVERIRSATLEALSNSAYRENAERLRRSFALCQGPAEAARLLMEVAETKRPALRERAYWAKGDQP